MKTKIARFLFCVASVSGAIHFAAAELPPTYTTAQAASHIGETATVCGKVEVTNHSARDNTFIDLDGAYPSQRFTALIPASSASIGVDVGSLEGKSICVTGMIVLYKSKPGIMVTAKEQIKEK